jgi:hypothetical protein
MHNSQADIDRQCVDRKGGGRGLLQIEATYKAEIINIVEYLNTKYIEDQFVNIVKSNESSQPSMNSTIKVTAKVAEGLNQSYENSDKKGRHSTHTSNQLNTHKLSQSLYCVLILYMFRASSVHLQEALH